MLKKLRSRKGTTMMEILVAAALMALLAAGIGGGISAAVPVCNDSLALSESSVLFSTLTQIITDELRYAREIQVDATSGDISFTSDRYGQNAMLVDSMTAGSGTAYTGRIWLKSDVGTFPLLGEGAYTTLLAELGLTYDSGAAGTSFFEVTLTITRSDGGQESRTFQVYPILQ